MTNNGKNDYSRLMANLDKRMTTGMNNLNESVIQGTKATVKQTRESESRLMKGIKTGMNNLNESVIQGTKATITQTRQSEKNLAKKIDSIKGVALKGVDWLVVFIVTALIGFAGWLFSQYMISKEMQAWVKLTETVHTDAAGNFINVTTSSEVLWPVVFVTVLMFALIGGLIAYMVVNDIRQKEGD